jgi:hypothetical protein
MYSKLNYTLGPRPSIEYAVCTSVFFVKNHVNAMEINLPCSAASISSKHPVVSVPVYF